MQLNQQESSYIVNFATSACSAPIASQVVVLTQLVWGPLGKTAQGACVACVASQQWQSPPVKPPAWRLPLKSNTMRAARYKPSLAVAHP